MEYTLRSIHSICDTRYTLTDKAINNCHIYGYKYSKNFLHSKFNSLSFAISFVATIALHSTTEPRDLNTQVVTMPNPPNPNFKIHGRVFNSVLFFVKHSLALELNCLFTIPEDLHRCFNIDVSNESL